MKRYISRLILKLIGNRSIIVNVKINGSFTTYRKFTIMNSFIDGTIIDINRKQKNRIVLLQRRIKNLKN